MEFSQNTIIDLALNVGGFLAAGALWTVLYALFTRPSSRGRSAQNDVPAEASAASAAIGDAVRQKRSPQFIDLTTGSRASELGKNASAPDQYRRNRSEVIRLARAMLKDGRSQQQVRDLLPITDGELALLAVE